MKHELLFGEGERFILQQSIVLLVIYKLKNNNAYKKFSCNIVFRIVANYYFITVCTRIKTIVTVYIPPRVCHRLFSEYFSILLIILEVLKVWWRNLCISQIGSWIGLV